MRRGKRHETSCWGTRSIEWAHTTRRDEAFDASISCRHCVDFGNRHRENRKLSVRKGQNDTVMVENRRAENFRNTGCQIDKETAYFARFRGWFSEAGEKSILTPLADDKM